MPVKGEVIYENKLSCEKDVEGFVMEGSAEVYFENGRMRMKNSLSENLGQKANFVYWCPENFPDDIIIEWKFRPIEEPGLAILFFSARGVGGEDIFDESLQKRDGQYNLYHSGDINAYHISYFRRMWEDERSFHTCNLRKSKGFHLVAQGGDPIPDAAECRDFYNMRAVKYKDTVAFYIDDLEIFTWHDDGKTYGKLLPGGKIGFRQMAPLIGEYSDLRVFKAEEK